ncbi:MAG TPA: beta-ketoacyl-ACP synthase II [Nevskiales bacterium]|nr:beta-ketoacyl-ACP synthase II [Nevskiales bacterium]
MARRRVVITGLGLVSPVGSTVKEGWENILAGRSGIVPITGFDVSTFPTKFAGLVSGFKADDYLSPKDQRRFDTFIVYGAAGAMQAMKDAGIEVTEQNAERIAVCVGSGIGGIGTIYDNCIALHEAKSPKKVSPFFVPAGIVNMVSGFISIHLGIKGPNFSPVSACTTSAHSIGLGARMIAYGEADIAITGGAEAAANPIGLAGFCAARALSTRNDDPQAASRPWDKDRDGFVLGDGAGILILEEYEHARKRGATIYAELAGFGMSGDAFHITLPSEGGEGAARCMNNALRDAGLNPGDVQYINAHGTSTLAGDVAETQAVKRSFGDHASKLAISSTKSMTGHLLGAAGGIEAIFSVLAIRDQVAPPTINLHAPSPDCDLDYVPNEARPMKIDVAMSNSFGFGGTNGTLIFRRLS